MRTTPRPTRASIASACRPRRAPALRRIAPIANSAQTIATRPPAISIGSV
jgi:hypothetical protein